MPDPVPSGEREERPREALNELREELIATRVAAAICAGTYTAKQPEMLDWTLREADRMVAPERVRQAVRQLVEDVRRYDSGTAGELEHVIRSDWTALAVSPSPPLPDREQTVKLAEAMFRAQYSDPWDEEADRRWPKVRGYWTNRAERLLSILRAV
jgi:hypothetical protein